MPAITAKLSFFSATFVLIVVTALAFVSYHPRREPVILTAPSDSFDGDRAFADLKSLVAFGPRPPGSQALDRTRQWITHQLQNAGVEIERDPFVAATPLGPIPMVNLVARIPGTGSSIVIVAGHYDTKRMASTFVGANDGGSSAAFLLELARVLVKNKHALTYWLVFFDGEEALKQWSATDGLYGSRHFVGKFASEGTLTQVRAVIVVDMIADAHLNIHRDVHSTPWLNDLVFTQARHLGYGRYFLYGGRQIEDDHMPFLERGLPAMDIIDLDYGPLNLHWHTRFDTVDRCSPTSLKIVGQVIQTTLQVLEADRITSTGNPQTIK